jgi:hypothetical protein
MLVLKYTYLIFLGVAMDSQVHFVFLDFYISYVSVFEIHAIAGGVLCIVFVLHRDISHLVCFAVGYLI